MFDRLLDHAEFFKDFGPRLLPSGHPAGITVCFNWGRFWSEKWPIELVPMQSTDAVTKCFVPWYPEAKPLSLGDVPSKLGLLGIDQKVGIAKCESRLTGLPTDIFAVPTYALPTGEFLIMDCAHRLSALVVKAMPFHIELCNVKGPMDKRCLMDLEFWI